MTPLPTTTAMVLPCLARAAAAAAAEAGKLQVDIGHVRRTPPPPLPPNSRARAIAPLDDGERRVSWTSPKRQQELFKKLTIKVAMGKELITRHWTRASRARQDRARCEILVKENRTQG